MARLFACGSHVAPRQLDALQLIITKHINDPAFTQLSDDFVATSVQRGLASWEQAHLVAALDVLNAYQESRKARSSLAFIAYRPGMRRSFRDDPRTRLVELLKRWLRANACSASLSEDEIRGICGLCREILNHSELFPARNPRSFLRSIAEVYDHLKWQLREVLERDRSCAELAQRVLTLSRNFISDSFAFLLLGPTDLSQTDELPSLEVVALWQSLPSDGHPLPDRVDPALQKAMKDAWRTKCGALLASLLASPWCLRLFAGAEIEAKSLEGSRDFSNALQEAKEDFQKGRFRNSGLAGAFRVTDKDAARKRWLSAAEALLDLTYLLGEVLVQFHRISDGLGDYGMISVAHWLHPFLEVLSEKVQRLKSHLEQLHEAVDEAYVLARARGQSVKSPAPTAYMSARAHNAMERAVTGRSSHAQNLVKAIEDLHVRSAPERLPHVVEALGEACFQLQAVLSSAEFRARVGNAFPDAVLPISRNGTAALTAGDGHGHFTHAGLTSESQEIIVLTRDLQGQGSRGSTTPRLAHDASLRCTWNRGSEAQGQWSPQLSPLWTAKAEATAPVLLGKGGFNEHRRGPLKDVQAKSTVLLRADVQRLMPSMFFGLARHDRRSLQVSNGRLLIFEKGSSSVVKSDIDISSIHDCSLSTDEILHLSILRGVETGAAQNKDYDFLFPTKELAKMFYNEIKKHLTS